MKTYTVHENAGTVNSDWFWKSFTCTAETERKKWKQAGMWGD